MKTPEASDSNSIDLCATAASAQRTDFPHKETPEALINMELNRLV